MDLPISPLAPASYADLTPVAGVQLATAEAGIAYRDRPDVLLVAFEEGTQLAGVLTRSKCPSAPVAWVRGLLANGTARALLVNAGNANAFTGMKGHRAVEVTAEAVARHLGCAPSDVMLASTGVIGEPLDPEGYLGLIGAMKTALAPDRWLDASRAIMTTDTFPKLAKRQAVIDGVAVTLNGIAKGSGMIAPDMATMLSFVMTDAPIAAPLLQHLLSKHCDTTFNSITVDSDTSTSDTLLAFATGRAILPDNRLIESVSDPRLSDFEQALADLLKDLALQVVRDGEGASKLIEICVKGATSDASAKKIALSIGNSPLVKTAMAGGDANWGRIVMAIGKAGEPADRDRVSIWFGDVRVAKSGERDPNYSEEAASAAVAGQEISVVVDLGLGEGEAVIWTCDLTHHYIDINADYRS